MRTLSEKWAADTDEINDVACVVGGHLTSIPRDSEFPRRVWWVQQVGTWRQVHTLHLQLCHQAYVYSQCRYRAESRFDSICL